MSESFLKKITRKQSYVERAASPYATDIDGCIPVEIDHFDKVGRHVVAVGTDLRTGEPVRMYRIWPRSHSRPNPMVSLAQRVTKGGVVMFQGAERIQLPGQENTWACSQHGTLITGHAENEEVDILHAEMAFLDPIEQDARGNEGQFYNVVNRRNAMLVRDEKDFHRALRDIFDTQKRDDTIILRGYSKADGLAASVRLFPEAGEDAGEFSERFMEANISLNIIGEIETVQSISGAEILSSLSDDESDMVWELIPVSAFYKKLTARDPDFTQKLQTAGQSLYEDFLLPKGGDTMGFRRSTLALKTTERSNGFRFTDVAALLHDVQPALPLALLDTPHSPDLAAIIPGYQEEVISYADAGDYEAQDLMSALRAELEKDATDFLDPETVADIAEDAPAQEADVPASVEENVSAPSESAAEDQSIEDLVASALGHEVPQEDAKPEPVQEPEVVEASAAAVEVEEDEEEIDFLDPDAFPIEDEVTEDTAEAEIEEVEEQEVDFGETVDLDSFGSAEEAPKAAAVSDEPAPKPAEHEATPDPEEPQDDAALFGGAIDLDSFEQPAPTPAPVEPAPKKEAAAAPAPAAPVSEVSKVDEVSKVEDSQAEETEDALFGEEINLDDFNAAPASNPEPEAKPAAAEVASGVEDSALFDEEIDLDGFGASEAPAAAPSAIVEPAPAPQPKAEASPVQESKQPASEQPSPAPAPAATEPEDEEVSMFGDLAEAPSEDGIDFLMEDTPEASPEDETESISHASDQPNTEQSRADDAEIDLSEDQIDDITNALFKM